MTKQEMRALIAQRVKNLSPVYCREADEAICRLVLQSDCCQAAQTIFCYAGSEREIDTMGLLHALLSAGKTVALPLCREKGVMEARRIEGMGDLVTKGSLAGEFKDCIVTAGAKTGSAQVGDVVANGVFVCFAPFEEPEIAVAVVIEQGRSGAALASTAVQILNDYFSPDDIGYAVVPEGELLP